MYHHVVAGGTFDALHRGHREFLSRAFASGERVTIGLTSDAYVRRFKQQTTIRSFGERKKTLVDWCKTQGVENRVNIVAIDNIYGPAILGDFDAIVATSETRANAIDINTVRKERGLPELAIIDVPMVPAEDDKPISSTRVRNGEIDREGHLILPDALRPELQKPLGKLLIGDAIGRSIDMHKRGITVSVGDVATEALLNAQVTPTLAVIDFQVQRKPYVALKDRLINNQPFERISSGPGHISKQALDFFETWGKEIGQNPKKQTILVVDGEEDLLTLLAIGHAPMGAVVYYGQPPITCPAGLVEVDVTPEKKREIASLLLKFL